MTSWLIPLYLSIPTTQAGDAPPGPAGVLDVRAVDLDGRVHRLGTEPELGPIALVFLDVACPVASRYAPRLNELAALARARGIGFFGVLSDPALSIPAAREYRAAREL